MTELSLHVLDIAQNSVSAGASLIEIEVAIDTRGDRMTISVTDNGKGMDGRTARLAQDPFYTTRTTRKVGLGIPLFKMSALMSGGSFKLEGRPGEGTRIEAVFGYSHIDRLPLGDMAQTMAALIAGSPNIDFVYRLSKDGRDFALDTREMRAVLADIPLSTPEVLEFVRRQIAGASEDIVQT
jgi:hypothetical protein